MNNRWRRIVSGALSAVLVLSSLPGSIVFADSTSVALNEENFPDETFRRYVKSQGDLNGDDVLSESELFNFVGLEILDTTIKSTKGLELLESLEDLRLVNCGLNSLDVSSNENLNTLYCSGNNLTTLNLANNLNLMALECNSNNLTSLDLSNNPYLMTLNCDSNYISELDLSNNLYLYMLICSNNNLSSLDVTNNESLIYLVCNNNEIEGTIDLSYCSELEVLDCEYNDLTSLNVSNSPYLMDLNFSNNQIGNIDLSNNIYLETLYCYNNRIYNIDLSNNTELYSLIIAGNGLSTLDLSNNPNIEFLYCAYNFITSLKISELTYLGYLDCSHNRLSSLDLSGKEYLTYLDCSINALSALNISDCTDMDYLNCSNNKLLNLNVTNNPYLEILYCSNNMLTSLDVSNNPGLYKLICHNNDISKLNIISNETLIDLLENGEPITPEYVSQVSLGMETIADYNLVEGDLSNVSSYGYTENFTNVLFFFALIADNDCLIISSCDHDFPEEWSKDKTNHWLECNACGIKTDFGPHEWNYESATEEHDKHCTICGYVIEEQLVHEHIAIPHEGVEATCLVDGSKTYYECRCGKFFEDEECLIEILEDIDEWSFIKATGHVEGEEATCETNQVCTVCGVELNPALGHVPSTGWNLTSTDHWQKCKVCGAKLNFGEHEWNCEAATEEHDKHCVICGSVAEKKLEHVHVGVLVEGTLPTCVKDGVKDYYTCKCGRLFEDEECKNSIFDLDSWIVIPATGHVPGEEETCTESQICTVCDMILVEALGHTPGTEANCVDNQICITCGATIKKALGHVPGDEETCEEDQICVVCEVVLNEATGHDYSNEYSSNEDYHFYSCVNCGGMKDLEEHEWNYSEATEEHDKHCVICGYVAQEQLEHVHKCEIVIGTSATCTNEGTKTYFTCYCGMKFKDYDCTIEIEDFDSWISIPKLPHTPGDEATCETPQICVICEEVLVEALGHDFETKYSRDELYHWHVCLTCGDKNSCEEHEWNYEEATEEHDKHCLICGYIAEDIIGHEHVGEIHEGTPATCVKDGTKDYYECSCGRFYEDEECTKEIEDLSDWMVIPATGHEEGDEATCETPQICVVCETVLVEALGHTPGAEATCETSQICTVCEKELVPALGHVEGEEATCETPQICVVCEKVLVEALGHTPGDEATCETSQICIVCEKELVPALGHTKGDEATCTKPQICTVCEKKLVPALGHVEGPEATCEEDQVCTVCGVVLEEALGHKVSSGWKVRGDGLHCQTCTVCGKDVNIGDHEWNVSEATEEVSKYCTVCGFVSQFKLPHTGVLQEGIPATCLEDGTKDYYECKCGKVFEDEDCKIEITDLETWIVIKATGHQEGDEATCETPQICLVCEEVLVEALGHTPEDEATCETPQICTVCEKELVPALGHVEGPEATCETPQICTVCEKVLVEAFGHTPGSSATCTTSQTCTTCGIELVGPLGHTLGAPATCTKNQICTTCKAVITPAKGHTPGAAATCTTPQICTVCNTILKKSTGHTNGPAATCTTPQICTTCNVILETAKGHVPGAKATCTTDQKCAVCNATLIKAPGHKPGAKATCTTDQKCTVCNATIVKATGHKPGTLATCIKAQICTVCSVVINPAKGHVPGSAATATTAQVCTVCNQVLNPALGVPVTPTPAPENGLGGFIERLYNIALSRSSEVAGKNWWINEVKFNNQTGTDVARGFLTSDEFLSKSMNNVDFLTVLYRTFFSRDPDGAGLNYWLSEMNNGASKTDVINGFCNSTEWANLCLTYGIPSGSSAAPTIVITPNEGTNAFVTRLYTTCLGRAPEQAGFEYWTYRLANMQERGSTAAYGFFTSTEFVNKGYNNATYVTLLYRTILGREPDQAGLNYWLGLMANGMSRVDILNGFAASTEWADICSGYGILK